MQREREGERERGREGERERGREGEREGDSDISIRSKPLLVVLEFSVSLTLYSLRKTRKTCENVAVCCASCW